MNESASPVKPTEPGEIAAFRYTAEADPRSFNLLNLNGLNFGGVRRRLSDRLLNGIKFRLQPGETSAAPEPVSEGLGVLRYHLPMQEYRAQRRRQAAIARRAAIALAIVVPVGLGAWLLKPHRAPVVATAPVAPVAKPTEPAAAPTAPTVYHVQAGDTLSTIAHRHHVRLRDLVAANGYLPKHRLKVGEAIQLPAAAAVGAAQPGSQAVAATQPKQGAAKAPVTPGLTTRAALAAHEGAGLPKKHHPRVSYHIRSGDSLSMIAHRFGVKVAAIVEINDLDRHTRLKVGRKIWIPTTGESASASRDEAKVEAKSTRGRRYRRHDGRKLAFRGILGDLGRVVAKHFLWPTLGHISSHFGYRGDHFHTGVDIPNHPGAPIHASKPGVVIAAHWEGNYGKVVDISHGSGVVTRYAHCSKLLVHPGEHVAQGETIALVGETGHATGPHLHYEVRVNGRPVDPLRFVHP